MKKETSANQTSANQTSANQAESTLFGIDVIKNNLAIDAANVEDDITPEIEQANENFATAIMATASIADKKSAEFKEAVKNMTTWQAKIAELEAKQRANEAKRQAQIAKAAKLSQLIQLIELDRKCQIDRSNEAGAAFVALFNDVANKLTGSRPHTTTDKKSGEPKADGKKTGSKPEIQALYLEFRAQGMTEKEARDECKKTFPPSTTWFAIDDLKKEGRNPS